MSVCETIRYWNTEQSERTAPYPCDDYSRPPYRRLLRAVDVEAPSAVTYRWVCQVKVAPYSYDLIDNLGRRSPQRLTPGADELAVGQHAMIGPIVDFEPGRSLTLITGPRATRIFGHVALTYWVSDVGPGRSRLLACLNVTASTRSGRLRRTLLGAGDLVMMRRQLLNLKRLAEHSATEVVKS